MRLNSQKEVSTSRTQSTHRIRDGLFFAWVWTFHRISEKIWKTIWYRPLRVRWVGVNFCSSPRNPQSGRKALVMYFSPPTTPLTPQTRPPPSFNPHPVQDMFGQMFGRTGLTIGGSKAKNAQEADFEVKMRLAPPKSNEHCKKHNFRSKFSKCCLFRIFGVFLAAKGRRRLEIGR